MRAGGKGQGLFIIHRGKVALTSHAPARSHRSMDRVQVILGPGDAFGWPGVSGVDFGVQSVRGTFMAGGFVHAQLENLPFDQVPVLQNLV